MAVLWVAAVACWLFIVVFTIDGWTRSGYQVLRQPVSALALGRRGWLQVANFLVCGAAVTAASVPIGRATDSILLGIVVGVFGVALVASGLFRMDPMRGYPPGTPEGTPSEFSRRHQLHDAAGAVVFVALPVAASVAVFVLPDVGWRVYSAATAVAGIIGLFAFGQAWEEDSPRAGLLQRLTLVVDLVWLGLVLALAT